jgi:sigma-B regulation protein RsbU (phosphoserine phosphatase)
VNCAHSEPLLLRRSGALQRLEPTATVVGAFARWSATEACVELNPGDMLTLYSDGVTEACGPREEEFGEERLLRVIRSNRENTAAGVVGAVIGAVTAFSPGTRSDDVTVMVLRGI